MEALCEGLRARYDVSGMPVDVLRLAERMGIHVREREWSGRPHAVCVPAARLVILNGRRPSWSRRFDLAHELGHFVLAAERRHSAQENRFAAVLLMPADEFKWQWIRVNGDLLRMAEWFGVSRAAVLLRRREMLWRG